MTLTYAIAPLTLAGLVALASPRNPDPASLPAAPPELNEWTVPWPDSRPRDPYVDQKGRAWFVGQAGDYVAYLEPRSGKFERYEIEPGTHPHNLVVDSKGSVWFTGNRNGRLVRLDPASRKLTDFPMPDATVDDPHTMILDGAGNPWFTAQQAAVVGRLDIATGKIRFWQTGEGTRPYGISVDQRQRVWIDLFGTNALAAINPETMKLSRYPLPEGARPRRHASTADGAVWYGDYARGYIGRLDPATGKAEEFVMPSGARALPYAVAADDRDRVWLAETGVQPNRLVAFDTRSRKFTDSVAVGGGNSPNTIRHMVFHAPTREIWFGTDRNTIGRLSVP
ncbi:MAG: Vgb family protein [Gemmatimonadales bacterium]